MTPNGTESVTWRGMPVNVALDILEGKLENVSLANTQKAPDLANSVNSTVAGTKYLADSYDKQSQITQKLLKELIDEINDYKEEFKRLSEHCDELEEEIKELKDKYENRPYIDMDKLKEKTENNGYGWPNGIPSRWEPVEISWEHPYGVGEGEGGTWRITCNAQGKTKTLGDGTLTLPALSS